MYPILIVTWKGDSRPVINHSFLDLCLESENKQGNQDMILFSFNWTKTMQMQDMDGSLSPAKGKTQKLVEKKLKMITQRCFPLPRLTSPTGYWGIGKIFLDAKTSKRIFELAKEQQDEIEVPDDYDEVVEAQRLALSRPRIQTMDMDDDDSDNEDLEDVEEVDDVEETFVRTFPSPPYVPLIQWNSK